MGRIQDATARYFDDNGWSYAPIEEDPEVLMLGFAVDGREWSCFAQAREAQEQLVFYSVCPFAFDDDTRTAAMEFITRANYGMILGNFELDLHDGEVRYKTSVDVEDGELTEALIRSVVHSNIAMMKRYLPGLERVHGGEVSAEEAVFECETTPA